MADLSDNFINSICFALALLYLALQAWRLARPFWAMRFEGKLAQLKKLMADNGLTFTEKELRRAVPADYAINTLLHRELTDAREIECRSAFRRALALFAAALLLTMGLGFFYSDPMAASYTSDLVLLALATVIAACARYRVLKILYYVADRMDEKKPEGA